MMNDLTKVSTAVMRLNQIASDVAQLKDAVEEIDVLKDGLSALRSDIGRCLAAADEMAELSEQVKKLSALGTEVVKLRDGLSKGGQERRPSGAVAADGALLEAKIKSLRDEIVRLKESLSTLEDMQSRLGQVQEQLAEAKKRPAVRRLASKGDKAEELGEDAEAIRAELAELREVVRELAASQPHLEIDMHEARLISQVDRTIIECSLSVKNLSNKPNEITAVRAELDSGRNRMTPTSIRHWLPEGMEVQEDRKIVLPMKVLEGGKVGPINLTAAGWPLEKAQEDYPFRITLKDKDGNEFVHNLRLKAEQEA